MKLEFSVDDDHPIPEACREQLLKEVNRFAADVVEEATRLEAAFRGSSGDPELTSTNIRDASIVVRRGLARRARSRLAILLDIVSYVGAVSTGVAATTLSQPLGPAFFAVSLTIGVLAKGAVLLMEQDR